MFIAMNRFKVIKEESKAFEDLWVMRESHLGEVKGFQAFHLLRGPEREDHVLYSSHTIWASQEDFTAWTKSEQFRAAHQHAGERKPLTRPRNSKGSKSSRRSKPRIRPHSGCSTLGIATGALIRRGRTGAVMPCACFHDHKMTAEVSKSCREKPLFIKA
jgi:heme-degrading monooxygenase HmoA